MAQPVDFPEANLTLVPPEGAEDDCIPMRVRRLDGQLVSRWKLSPDEMIEVLRTGEVWLSVWGQRTAPPVMVSAHKHEVI